jgi:hypothetical protein
MSELRPAMPSDLDAFPNADDAYGFAELVEIDETWKKIYDSRYETLDEQESKEADAHIVKVLSRPEFPDHLVGYLYAGHVTPKEWMSTSEIVYMFTSPSMYRGFDRAQKKLFEVLDDLLDKEVLTRYHSVYQLGPRAPLDKFPELDEGFEAWVHDFLSTHTFSCPIRFVSLEHFADGVTPFEYWAGKHKIYQMIREEKLVLDSLKYVMLPKQEDPELDQALDVIDAQLEDAPEQQRADPHLSEDVERRLREFGMNKIRVVKPRQRGNQGGIGPRRR